MYPGDRVHGDNSSSDLCYMSHGGSWSLGPFSATQGGTKPGFLVGCCMDVCHLNSGGHWSSSAGYCADRMSVSSQSDESRSQQG